MDHAKRTKAHRAEDDHCNENHDQQYDELHFEVLPPHLVPQCPSRLVEFICLETKIVRSTTMGGVGYV